MVDENLLVARESITSLLGVRLLAFRLSIAADVVGRDLELVAEVLGGRLLGVGLDGG